MLAELRRPVADDAVEGRADGGVGQAVGGQPLGGLGGNGVGLGLGHLGGGHRQCLLGVAALGAGGIALRLRLALVGDGLLVGLPRGPAGADQRTAAAGLGGGPGQFGVGLVDRRLGLVDRHPALRHLGPRGGDGGGGLHGTAAGLLEARRPIRRVEPDQRIASMDELVVGDGNGGHIALDARRQHGDVALHIGVVGTFDPAPLDEPPVADQRRRQRQDRGGEHAQGAPAPARRGADGDREFRRGLVGDGIHGRNSGDGRPLRQD